MGKKTKVGKQRKDRFYQLAKETGYRSRASFKLIQLNRKFEFLQRSRVLIDLCAAPGGWLQVAQKFMPVSSVIVGIDLVPIKAIHNVITLQSDITTPECRSKLKKELKTWKADVILNDGAPNIGKSWLHDAYNQNRLTLSALQLASEFLMRGGWFVTKIFRSKDYNALIWVCGKLFKKVHATKPQASRNESAEIFVVCQNYLAPDSIDPKFFDPSYLFEDVGNETTEKMKRSDLLKQSIRTKKPKAEGYEPDDYTLHHKINASDFIQSNSHIQLLSKTHEILMDSDEIINHPLTTDEVKECCKDIQVLGRKELLLLINWRRKLKSELYKEEKPEITEEKNDTEVEEIDESDNEEEKQQKRKKRKILKERKKLNERMNLKMVLKNDQLVEEMDFELFQLKKLKNKDIAKLEEIELSEEEKSLDSDDDPESNIIYFDKDSKRPWGDMDKSKDDDGDESDEGIEDVDEDDDTQLDETLQESDDENGLIVDLNEKVSRKDKTDMFFSKPIFQEYANDNDLDLIEEDRGNKKKRKSLKKIQSKDESSDEEFDMNEFQNDKKEDDNRIQEKCQKDLKLDAEGMAIATEMIKSKKSKRDILDEGWNRYMHADENMPSWFRKDEEKHFRKPFPIPDDVAKEHQQRMLEINARPIKKVAEAKARKKKRVIKKLDRAKKKAEALIDAPDMSEKEKASHIKNLYKKAMKQKDKNVTYVVAKKGKSARKPKGRYKIVDPRMKKDRRAKEMKEKKNSKKGNQKKSFTNRSNDNKKRK